MPEDNWTNVASYSDRISAEAVLGLLKAENVPGYIASNEDIPGLGSEFSVLVPPQWRSRALGVLRRSQVPEAELTFLALGKVPNASDSE
jgi:hypothetical protein